MPTVSKANILAVLESTFSKIAEDVADGKTVYVGEHFTLQEKKPTKMAPPSIKSARMAFRPEKMIKDEFKLATFQKKS